MKDKNEKYKNNSWIALGRLYNERYLQDSDYEETKIALEKMGYDTSKDIHKQFMEKYNLNLED